jgi:hypothetical protein
MKRLAGMLATLLLMGGPCLAAGAFPWKAGDTAPMLAHVSLGDSEDHARQVLGPPESTSKMGAGDVLEYPAKGIEIVATKDDGVSIIRLRSPDAGAIDGIRIGDAVTDVMAKWGSPSGGQGRVALYDAGTWTVEVRLEENGSKVIDILLAWNQTKWGPPPPDSKTQVFRPQ